MGHHKRKSRGRPVDGLPLLRPTRTDATELFRCRLRPHVYGYWQKQSWQSAKFLTAYIADLLELLAAGPPSMRKDELLTAVLDVLPDSRQSDMPASRKKGRTA